MALGVDGAMRRIEARSDEHAQKRAMQARDIAATEHRNAPRGGINKNRYGQFRSAPGEPPATEEGDLLRYIQGQQPLGMRLRPGHYRVGVNLVVLEFGFSVGLRSRISDRKTISGATLEPRPLGRITVDKLKRRA